MPDLKENLTKNHFTPSEIRFSVGDTGAIAFILRLNKAEARGAKFDEIKQYFARSKIVYSDYFIEETLEKLTPLHLVCKNGLWHSVGVYV